MSHSGNCPAISQEHLKCGHLGVVRNTPFKLVGTGNPAAIASNAFSAPTKASRMRTRTGIPCDSDSGAVFLRWETVVPGQAVAANIDMQPRMV